MKNKILINLHGTSCVGKSHLLHALYKPLKDMNLEVFTADEAIKIKAYEKQDIPYYKHLEVFYEEVDLQWRGLYTEDIDIVISDSPITLSAFYFKKYNGQDIYYPMINYYKKRAEDNGVIFLDYFIMPNKGYSEKGRFQTEEESRNIQTEMLEFFRVFYGLEDKNILKGSDEQKMSRILSDVTNIYKSIDSDKFVDYNVSIERLKM